MSLTFNNADMPAPSLWDQARFFFLSDQWIAFRYQVLSTRGNRCECCGDTWSIGNPLQVDHIKPRSKYPHLALDPGNAQVLCRACNMGKGAIDCTDWRRIDREAA